MSRRKCYNVLTFFSGGIHMATSKIQTGLRLDETIYSKVKSLSELEGRSINNLIEFIVRRYISEYENENGPLPVSHD